MPPRLPHGTRASRGPPQPSRCWPSSRKEAGVRHPLRMPFGKQNEQGQGGKRQPTGLVLFSPLFQPKWAGRTLRPCLFGLQVLDTQLRCEACWCLSRRLPGSQTWEAEELQRSHDPRWMLPTARSCQQIQPSLPQKAFNALHFYLWNCVLHT